MYQESIRYRVKRPISEPMEANMLTAKYPPCRCLALDCVTEHTCCPTIIPLDTGVKPETIRFEKRNTLKELCKGRVKAVVLGTWPDSKAKVHSMTVDVELDRCTA